jgi:hypothetical protein
MTQATHRSLKTPAKFVAVIRKKAHFLKQR